MTWTGNRRILVLALLAALGLNLFLGSVIAGHWMRSGERSWSATSMIERRAERLPEADAAILQRAFATRRAELEASFEAWRAARERARTTAAAEPFEAGGLATALGEVRARTDALQQGFHELYLEIAPQISAEGRRALFERRRSGARG